jgi:hypothetical protein
MRWRWWLIGLFAAGAVLGVVRPHKQPDQSMAYSQDVVEAAVRPYLRDPQSAAFSGLLSTNDRKIKGASAGLVVCGHVNAKNGFGGYTGDKAFINFYATRLVEIEPTPRTSAFVASWNSLCAG